MENEPGKQEETAAAKEEEEEGEVAPYEDPTTGYNVDDAVKVLETGTTGKVTGKARGRVGVLLDGDDANKSFLPHQIEKAGENATPHDEETDDITLEPYDDLTAAYNTGDQVRVHETGTNGKVTGRARGRVGVLLEGEDANKSFLPHQIEKVEGEKGNEEEDEEVAPYEDLTSAFNVDDRVKVLESGAKGRVTGKSRGRVGVLLDDEIRSFFPHQLVTIASSEGEAGEEDELEVTPYDDPTAHFNTDDSVKVTETSENGKVTGKARGRVGVLLQDSGTIKSFFPQQLEKATDDDEEDITLEPYEDLTAAYNVDDTVKILETGTTGKVTGKARGRVGVLLDGDDANNPVGDYSGPGGQRVWK
eukprot:TRINITY_DN4074_c0_g1_i2.p1 TRINITY_DN4074_c0_g1~~TRINITY_DN4074_c0_g1_i2.p1  ORF type:complete len:361 (+),score=65.37 TRINITY_DN4074_c0_g1_i2:222-1304(+)